MAGLTETQQNVGSNSDEQLPRCWNRVWSAVAAGTLVAAGFAAMDYVPWEQATIGSWRPFGTDCTTSVDINETPTILNVEGRQIRLTAYKIAFGEQDMSVEIAPKGKKLGLLGKEFKNVIPRYETPGVTEFNLGNGHDLVLKFDVNTITTRCVDASTG